MWFHTAAPGDKVTRGRVAVCALSACLACQSLRGLGGKIVTFLQLHLLRTPELTLLLCSVVVRLKCICMHSHTADQHDPIMMIETLQLAAELSE